MPLLWRLQDTKHTEVTHHKEDSRDRNKLSTILCGPSLGTQVSQRAAVSKQLWNPRIEQKPGLSCISLFNSLFILASKPTEVKTWYVKFLLQASKLSSVDQVARFYLYIQFNRKITLKYTLVKKTKQTKKKQAAKLKLPQLRNTKFLPTCMRHSLILCLIIWPSNYSFK